MALSMLPLLALSALFVYPNIVSANTNFTCSADSTRSCQTYLTYRARPPYANLGNISDLFGISRLSIAQANKLTSENKLLYDQLLLIPVKCSCIENSYFANVTYSIKKGDSFYVVATSVFQNVTNYLITYVWQPKDDMNPSLNPTNLTVGEPVVFPLLCKCPALFQNQDKYLITYVWQPKDEILQVSSMFNTSSYNIVNENSFRNFTAAACLPVLIPVSKLPIFPPPGFKSKRSKKGEITFIVLGNFGSFFFYLFCHGF
ncbi:putative non-specific serine/threonine protein kinase [Helianthus annuus]|uniref:Non-specific serine/threonine protein kinase n=1 Tax=Helianthus annuus TaxID=4232 RepID=A0A251V303_HELAN|nr:putative non-specific serine/threonine protein kinase [Helianthus annuus]KAJ0598879.1 putative non-specific serine/threonine protein kinase [Helianthus annuus]